MPRLESPGHVLIAGASGVIGQSAIEAFARCGWTVTGLSRRRPDVGPLPPYQHIVLDLGDAAACRAASARFSDVTHLVYAALFEKPGLVSGWREQEQMLTNLAMLRNLLDPLLHEARDLRHISALQGTKAYGVHIHRIPIPAREASPRDNHENFYWLQEDLLRERASGAGWTLTIWRPQAIFGGACGVAMNVIPVIGAYAAICRELGRPLAFPGRPGGIGEAVDADLLGSALVWAASDPLRRKGVFNITNGDVFVWKNVWPAVARCLGMEPSYGEPFSLASFLADHAGMWDCIVEKYRLRKQSLAQLCGESHYYADLMFGTSLPSGQRDPILVSTIKLRRAGFADCADTEEVIAKWLRHFAARGIIPAIPDSQPCV
jgi:nucleoside-diphosphate-sugar epimerase